MCFIPHFPFFPCDFAFFYHFLLVPCDFYFFFPLFPCDDFLFKKLSRSTLSLWLSFSSFFCLHFSLLPYDFTFIFLFSFTVNFTMQKYQVISWNLVTWRRMRPQKIFLWKESKTLRKTSLSKNACIKNLENWTWPCLEIGITSLIKLIMINLRNQKSKKIK